MKRKTGNITNGHVKWALATPSEAARARCFLDQLRARARRPSTLVAYESDWRSFASWSSSANSEPFDLTRLVAREVSEFRNHLLRLRQAPATVNRRLAFLREYAHWAAEEGHIPVASAKNLAAVPNVLQQPLAPRGLTKTELRRFLKEVDLRGTLRDKALIYLMLHTGLRLGEAAALRTDDVTLSARRGQLKLRSEWAKGGKERTVPIPLAARTALMAYIVGRPQGPGGHTFQGERGPIGRAGITKVIAKHAANASVVATPHSLRHCFAYRYLEQSNNDLVGLAALLGHSNLNTTLGYTRRRLEDLEDAMEGLEFT